MEKFISEQIHCGQYKRYGDFFRVWKIITKEDEESTLNYCFSELYTRKVPEATEWHRRIRYGNDKSNDAEYYFGGYYGIVKNIDGFEFSICEPFTD